VVQQVLEGALGGHHRLAEAAQARNHGKAAVADLVGLETGGQVGWQRMSKVSHNLW
jgi:hypothetical protein